MNLGFTARKVLMASYLYYVKDVSIITDAENDLLCKELHDNWEQVPMRYRPFLDPDGVGKTCVLATSYHCKHSDMIIGGANAWLKSKGENKDE